MLIAKISQEQKEELERLEKDFSDNIVRMNENEKAMKDNLQELQNRKDELEK